MAFDIPDNDVAFNTNAGLSAGASLAVRGLDRSCASRLSGDPQLQVLGSVVVAPSIPMVDILTRQEWPTDHLLHHHPMLGTPCPATPTATEGCLDPDVPVIQVCGADLDGPLLPRFRSTVPLYPSRLRSMAPADPLILRQGPRRPVARSRAELDTRQARLEGHAALRARTGREGITAWWVQASDAEGRSAGDRAHSLRAVVGPKRAPALPTIHVWDNPRAPAAHLNLGMV